MSRINLTPFTLSEEKDDLAGHLAIYNWFCGGHSYGTSGYNWVVNETRDGRLIGKQIFTRPYVDETLRTLYEKARVLMVAIGDYSSNTGSTDFKYQCSLKLKLYVSNYSKHTHDQLLITFDIEALRSTDVQVFYWDSHLQTFNVKNRTKIMVVTDIIDSSSIFYLRPVNQEIYFYEAKIETL